MNRLPPNGTDLARDPGPGSFGTPAFFSSDADDRLRLVEPDRASKKRGNMRTLIGNTIVGLVLLFVTNLFLAEDLPINIITVVICAILGVLGWALVLILHLLGIAF